ncbi:MAG: L-fucose transporter [Chitinophagaceae bacterium]|nr:L-fucose transporter [Chitinophagaceae bacterium]
MKKTQRYTFAVVLITSLFFLWGFAHNLNPILIPHLKKACQLTDMQSAFIDSSFFIAYFLIALPAGMFMKRYGYKAGICFGLLLFAAGAFLFYPAASIRDFGFFLLALFVIASGLTFLETAANPYINALGDPSKAAQRLNFAQSFNGLAATLAPLFGRSFILSGNQLTQETKAGMSPGELNAFLNKEASAVQIPYLVIGLVVLLFAFIIWRTSLPEIAEDTTEANEIKPGTSIWKEKNLVGGVLAQFFYVGAQVCVGSFFIRYCGFVAAIDEKAAALYLSIALLGFMIGRFFGTFLMKYIKPSTLLFVYSVVNIILLLVVIMYGKMLGIYSLIGVEFFMSIMFPTIFSLGLEGLGRKTKQGSSLLIMSIVGGALLPLLMGRVSDASKSIQIAYAVPAICFIPIAYFAARFAYRNRNNITAVKVQPAH